MKDAAIQFVSLASDALVVTFLGNWPKEGDVPATGERVLQVRETTPSGISYNSELLEKWDASLLAFVSDADAIPGVRRRKLRHIGRELPRSTRPSRRSNRSPPPWATAAAANLIGTVAETLPAHCAPATVANVKDQATEPHSRVTTWFMWLQTNLSDTTHHLARRRTCDAYF
ncbi:hypothetical protein [Desulfosediminicola ganghwensis]|uniref:hypothetical protein n=1 Tax=Desulfosediminicola ganghwensis TaxID=2569540 RepID=UPI0010AD633D|nr:hypothetical protein [Desulfosediminicola ganghwensis]